MNKPVEIATCPRVRNLCIYLRRLITQYFDFYVV